MLLKAGYYSQKKILSKAFCIFDSRLAFFYWFFFSPLYAFGFVKKQIISFNLILDVIYEIELSNISKCFVWIFKHH